MTTEPAIIRPRIRELRLRKFRAFANSRLELSDFTVIVGRNGAGKSTLMEAFDFLQDAVTHSVQTALERRGGVNALIHRPSVSHNRHLETQFDSKEQKNEGYKVTASDIEIAIDLQLPATNVLYGFTLGPYRNKSGFRVKREILKTYPKSTFSFERKGPGFYTQLRHVAPSVAPESLVLPLVAEHEAVWRFTIEALRGLLVYDFSPQIMQAEPRIGSQQSLARDGSNIGDVIGRMDRDAAEMDWIIRHLASVTRGISRVVTRASAGRRIMEFSQQTGGRQSRFVASEMSKGTLHSLGVLVALRQKPVPSLVFVDELEASVHTAALSALMDAAQLSSLDRCQVVVSSHSTDALSHPAVNGENIRIVDWQNGRSEIYRIGPGTKELLVPPESVGRLLRSNSLWMEDSPDTIDGDIFDVRENAK
jgi:predicted ATPase